MDKIILPIFILGFLLIPAVYAADSAYPNKTFILISWDGTDKSTLTDLISEGRLPALSELIKSGTFVNISVTDHQSDALAGYVELFTGYPPSITSTYTSFRYGTIPAGYTISERLKENNNRTTSTAMVVSSEKTLGSLPGLPLYAAQSHSDSYFSRNDDAEMISSAAVETIYQNTRGNDLFLFIQFRDPAYTGLAHSGNLQKYKETIVRADNATGKIIQTIHNLGIEENTAIFITTNYGLPMKRDSRDEEKNIWLVSSIPLEKNDGDQKDIVPTILSFMGCDPEHYIPAFQGASLI